MKRHTSIATQMVLIFLVFSSAVLEEIYKKESTALLPLWSRTIVLAGVSVLQGSEEVEAPAAPAGEQAEQERLRKAAASYVQLLLATVLLLLFMLISVILAILLRRRRVAGRKRPEPTVLEDLCTQTEERKR